MDYSFKTHVGICRRTQWQTKYSHEGTDSENQPKQRSDNR